jgi:hypothetical protein
LEERRGAKNKDETEQEAEASKDEATLAGILMGLYYVLLPDKNFGLFFTLFFSSLLSSSLRF